LTKSNKSTKKLLLWTPQAVNVNDRAWVFVLQVWMSWKIKKSCSSHSASWISYFRGAIKEVQWNRKNKKWKRIDFCDLRTRCPKFQRKLFLIHGNETKISRIGNWAIYVVYIFSCFLHTFQFLTNKQYRSIPLFIFLFVVRDLVNWNSSWNKSHVFFCITGAAATTRIESQQQQQQKQEKLIFQNRPTEWSNLLIAYVFIKIIKLKLWLC
jgi:hypothetical protein